MSAQALQQSSPADARRAGLVYVSDATPGIRRRRRGRHFQYVAPDGGPLRDTGHLARIRSLAIPPAWTDVWICPSPNGHVQATGRDARGRKQYRYHPRWRAIRDADKYGRMVAFARALPWIRARVAEDLRRPVLSRERVLATVVRLLETTLIRVGNEEYARENGSFGLTTLRQRHVSVEGGTLRFVFRAKGGSERRMAVHDRRVARAVRRLEELPGRELFQYLDEEGRRQRIDSGDVNEYLREASGDDFTAKDFRTWAGTVLAARALGEVARFDSEAQARRNVVRAIEAVAGRLGNTQAICRRCYVHPAVIDSYLDGSLVENVRTGAPAEPRDSAADLSAEEAAVLALLERRLRRESR
jgi:DNA topoisomerase-1